MCCCLQDLTIDAYVPGAVGCEITGGTGQSVSVFTVDVVKKSDGLPAIQQNGSQEVLKGHDFKSMPLEHLPLREGTAQSPTVDKCNCRVGREAGFVNKRKTLFQHYIGYQGC